MSTQVVISTPAATATVFSVPTTTTTTTTTINISSPANQTKTPPRVPLDWSGRLFYAGFFLLALTLAALFVCLLCWLTSYRHDDDVDEQLAATATKRRKRQNQVKMGPNQVRSPETSRDNNLEATANISLPLAHGHWIESNVSQKMLVDRKCLTCVGCSNEKFLTQFKASVEVQQF